MEDSTATVSGVTSGRVIKMLTLEQREDYAIEAIKGVLTKEACFRYAGVVTFNTHHMSESDQQEVLTEIDTILRAVGFVFL